MKQLSISCRLLFVLLAPLTLMHCASYSSFQTAKTLEKGELSGSVGLGNNYLGEEPFVDIALRTGVADDMDVGAKLNVTNYGSSMALVDMKKQLSAGDGPVYHAVGLGAGFIFSDDKGVAIHLPYYLSLHSADNLWTFYTNPRALYFIDGDQEDEFQNTGPGLGSSFGIKVGRKFSLMLEYGFVYGQYDGENHFNNLLSGGIGINIK
ncbi:hypothetical protein [Marinoscillum sp.]|uniref:hypothetical protein n=1 Tax=Marinoscillum sp. TaxID=2024838 RepID=UPI003BABBA6A